MSNSRTLKSRSKELSFIISIAPLSIRKDLKNYLKGLSKERRFISRGYEFIHGDILSLLSVLDYSFLFPLEFTAEKSYHLDTLKKSEKERLERDYKLSKGSLTKKSKIDVFYVSAGEKYLLTLKDHTGKAKLGQFSSCTNYGTFKLCGGFNLKEYAIQKPSQVKYEQTALTERQFNKLSLANRAYAYIKENQSQVWNSYVNDLLNLSYDQLELFGEALNANKNDVLRDFLYKTLIGFTPNTDTESVVVLIETKSVGLVKLLDRIISHGRNFSASTESKKLILSLTYNGKTFYIARVWPSFDGAKAHISQTKGIIYYIQEYSLGADNHPCSFWDLLEEVSKDIKG